MDSESTNIILDAVKERNLASILPCPSENFSLELITSDGIKVWLERSAHYAILALVICGCGMEKKRGHLIYNHEECLWECCLCYKRWCSLDDFAANRLL